MTRLFVYGSLMSGEKNHHVLAGARFVTDARTAPRFTMVTVDAYPAIVTHGTTAISGELYEVDARLLAALDTFEGHPDMYRRTSIEIEGGDVAQAYVMAREQARGRVIASGDWKRR